MVIYLDSGHLLWADTFSWEIYRSRGTWNNFEAVQRAYADLVMSDWEPVKESL
jgi:hypothetical protein